VLFLFLAAEETEDEDFVMTRSAHPRRQIARTMVMQRVRNAIEEHRVAQSRRLRRIVSSDEEREVMNHKTYYVLLSPFLKKEVKEDNPVPLFPQH